MMRIRLTRFMPTSLLCLAVMLPSPGRAQEARGQPVGIAGTTVDTRGTPVDSVHVTLRRRNGDMVSGSWSTAAGTYLLSVPEDGSYRVRADVPGYLPTESHLFELRAEGQYRIDLELTRVAPELLARNTPHALLQEWVDRNVPNRLGDVWLVDSAEWRDAALGRSVAETIEVLDLPVSVRTLGDPGRFCVVLQTRPGCVGIGMLTHQATPRLRDLTPDRVDALVLLERERFEMMDPTAEGGRYETMDVRVILFLDGYLVAR